MKKITAMILMLILCIGLITTASATGTGFTIGSKSAMVGDIIEIPVTFQSSSKTMGIAFNLLKENGIRTYDNTVLEFIGFVNKCNFSTAPTFNSIDDDEEYFSFGWLSAQDFSSGIKICDLKFKVIGKGDITVNAEVSAQNETGSGTLECSVTPSSISAKMKTITGITFSDATYTYDGTEKSLAIKGNLPTDAKVEYKSNKATDAGTYNATAKITCAGYNDLTLKANLKINTKELKIKNLSANNKTYNGTNEATLSGGALDGVIPGDDVSATIPTKGKFEDKNVGDNKSVTIDTIALSGTKAKNYTLEQPADLKANITPAEISITAIDETMKVGTALPDFKYNQNIDLFGDDKMTGSLKVNTNGQTVGTFDIVEDEKFSAGNNYKITFTKGTLTVQEKDTQTITITGIETKTYGDSAFEIGATSTSGLTDFTYESSNPNVAKVNIDENNGKATITINDAGETEISVTQAGNEAYASKTEKQILKVNKKDVTVTSIDLENKTAVLDGVLTDDTAVELDFDKINIEIVDEATENTSNVLLKNLVLKGEKANNYNVTTESVAGVIENDKIVEITATAENGTVSGTGNYIKGSNVTLNATPDNGYRFDGWYNGETQLSTDSIYTFTAEENATLTAKFSLIPVSSGGGGSSKYSVTFNTNGGSKVTSQKVSKNGVAKEPATPEKDGFDFDGWYSDKSLTQKYDFSQKITGSITLYAKWSEKDNSENEIVLTIGKKNATVFGQSKTNDVAPVIRNDRTMLPARFIAESLGASVEWNEELQQVTITKGEIVIVITIGSDKVTVNGEEKTIDSPAFIENNRTYTPIRFISEELGATVEWDEETQTVTITKQH